MPTPRQESFQLPRDGHFVTPGGELLTTVHGSIRYVKHAGREFQLFDPIVLSCRAPLPYKAGQRGVIIGFQVPDPDSMTKLVRVLTNHPDNLERIVVEFNLHEIDHFGQPSPIAVTVH